MARVKGDVTVSTMMFVLDTLVDHGTYSERSEAFAAFAALVDEGNAEAIHDLVEKCEGLAKGPRGKPGRKSSIDQVAITRDVLAGFKGPDGTAFTPESYMALPEGALRTALNSRVAAALNQARAVAKAAKVDAEIAKVLSGGK